MLCYMYICMHVCMCYIYMCYAYSLTCCPFVVEQCVNSNNRWLPPAPSPSLSTPASCCVFARRTRKESNNLGVLQWYSTVDANVSADTISFLSRNAIELRWYNKLECVWGWEGEGEGDCSCIQHNITLGVWIRFCRAVRPSRRCYGQQFFFLARTLPLVALRRRNPRSSWHCMCMCVHVLGGGWGAVCICVCVLPCCMRKEVLVFVVNAHVQREGTRVTLQRRQGGEHIDVYVGLCL